MYNANMIAYNTQTGIELARQGRKQEALAYLRQAVLTEPVAAEVWLWLAHVSPDLNEYRNCVHQALILEPEHPTALRMQQDLDYQAYGASPPMAASEAARTMAKPHSRKNRWRRILALLNAIVLVVACGLLFNLLSNRVDIDDVQNIFDSSQTAKRISFSVGPEAEAINFRVDVPETWLLADVGSPSWREQRDRLGVEFPAAAGQSTIWQQLESDLGEVQRDENSGDFLQSVAIMETDSALIGESPNATARAVLVAVKTIGDNSCESLRSLAAEEESRARQTEGFIEVSVRERENDCAYYSQYRQIPATGEAIRFFQVNIPAGDSLLAIWHVSLPESLYEEHYQESVDTFIDTLQFVEP
jgi:hypothetical protein